MGTTSRRRSSVVKGAGLLVAAACLVLPLALSAPASAAGRAKTLSTLQQGLRFYRGKTVTFIIISAPGGSVDEEGRAVLQYMGQYLHADFNPENISTGNLIPGQDDTAAATPNGLTIGMANAAADILDQLTDAFAGINFNLAREDFIGSVPGGDNVFIVPAKSPIENFAQLLHTPGVAFLGTGQGITDINMRTVDAIWGLQFHFITGYATTAALVAGFARGDGQMMGNNLSTVGPLVAGGVARGILQTLPPPKGLAYAANVASVPTLTQLAKRYPPKTKNGTKLLAGLLAMQQLAGEIIIAPTKTPTPEVVALRAAFDWTIANPGFKALMLGEGNPVAGSLDGATAKQRLLTIQKSVSVLRPALLP